MDYSKEVKFGKHKGKTWEDLFSFEAGLSWLEWWSAQEPRGSEAKWVAVDKKQKEDVKNRLKNLKGGDGSDTSRAVVQAAMNSGEVLTKLNEMDIKLNILIARGHMSEEKADAIAEEFGAEKPKWDE